MFTSKGMKLPTALKTFIFTVLTVLSLSSVTTNAEAAYKVWVPGHWQNHHWVPGHYVYRGGYNRGYYNRGYYNRGYHHGNRVWVPANRYHHGYWMYR